MTKLLALVLLVASSFAAEAATWYVDQSGTGAGAADGSTYENRFAGWTDAWLTAGDIDAGDTVYACGTQTGTMAFSDGGSVGNQLIIDGACPKGDGTYDYGRVNANGATCWTSLTTRTYITVQNVTFYGFTGTCLDMRTATGNKVLDNAFIGTNNGSDTALIIGNNTATVQDNTFTRVSSSIATRGCTTCLIDSNFIEYGGAYGTGSTANLDGIAIDDSGGVGCEGSIVSNNVVMYQGGSQGSGIDFQCSAGTGVVKAFGNLVLYGEGVGVTVGSLSTLSHLIYSNISAYNALNAWYQKTTNTPAEYYGIIGIQAEGNAQSAFRFGDGSSSTMTATLKNSVLIGDVQSIARTTTSGTLIDSHNYYIGPLYDTTNGTRTLAQWISDGQCSAGGCDDEDPKFTGGTRPGLPSGFRLKADSPLLRRGVCYVAGACAYPDFADRRHRRPPNIGAWATGKDDQL